MSGPEIGSPSAGGASPRPLPPEVEEELRRRAHATATAAPPATTDTATARDDAAKGEGWGGKIARFGPVALFALFLLSKLKLLAGVGKFLLPAVQFLKLGKLLTTGSTMLLSVGVYAQIFGWKFAVGFVLSIFAHEMGHVYAAWRLGLPVSAPIFIPGMGALILQKKAAKSTWDEALIGIGGPIAGTLAGLLCLAVYAVTGSGLMLALAYTGFLINLFNLIPIFPLDGGWITGAVSPRLWTIGLAGMVALFATGMIRNPFILLILLLSLPRLWHGLRTGDVTPEGGSPVTPRQRMAMGSAYIALCGSLAWLMAVTHVRP